MKTEEAARWCGVAVSEMAVYKRRSEVKDDHDTSRKPSALFWKEDSMNKPRIGAMRKKDNSGPFHSSAPVNNCTPTPPRLPE